MGVGLEEEGDFLLARNFSTTQETGPLGQGSDILGEGVQEKETFVPRSGQAGCAGTTQGGSAGGKRYLAIGILHVVVPWQWQAPPGLLWDQMFGFAQSLPGWFLAVVGVSLQKGGSLTILLFVRTQHICLLAFFNFLLFGRQPRACRTARLSLLSAS